MDYEVSIQKIKVVKQTRQFIIHKEKNARLSDFLYMLLVTARLKIGLAKKPEKSRKKKLAK
jgi:hypothetical protein